MPSSIFRPTADTVQLKHISYPSGGALGSHLMSFMDVQYELPLLQQTSPLSSDTQLERPIKECKYYLVHISVMKYPHNKLAVT